VRPIARKRVAMAAGASGYLGRSLADLPPRDTADFPRFNETFREYMAGEKVTRTCAGGVPHRAGINVEIDCVAMFD
jgi:hypothetical protein